MKEETRLRRQREFIEKSQIVHNKYDYSKVIFQNVDSKVIIICPNHGEFSQTPSSHLSGKCGCPECFGNKKLGIENFIKRAKILHGDFYDYREVDYKNTRTKVSIICPIHGKFRQSPANHLAGYKCSLCGNFSRRMTLEEFTNKSHQIHNNFYNYSLVDYQNNYDKIKIICPNHGEFSQIPMNHLKGHKCSKCSGNIKLTKDIFIARAKEIHQDTYDYSLVDYQNNYEKVKIICFEHGEFLQIPADHLEGHKCRLCSHYSRRTTLEDFINKAHQIHNYFYNYSLVDYQGNYKKVKIICSKHGIFEQLPSNHLSGKGCLKCSKTISRSEAKWLDSLNIKHRNIILPNLGRKRVDGFDPLTNTVYEFYGDFWHGNPEVYPSSGINSTAKKTFGELYIKTIEREELIKKAGYNLIFIWEKDYKAQKCQNISDINQ